MNVLDHRQKKGDIPFPFALLFNYANEYTSELHLQNECILIIAVGSADVDAGAELCVFTSPTVMQSG